MNVALAGLTAREEVALGMLVAKSLPGWQSSAVPGGRQASLPPADLYVIDLAGRGLARWSEASQNDLFAALGGAPAVLVAPAFDQTWSALDAKRMKNQSLVLLHKPYGTEEMRVALSQAAAGCAARAPQPAISAAAAAAPVRVPAPLAPPPVPVVTSPPPPPVTTPRSITPPAGVSSPSRAPLLPSSPVLPGSTKLSAEEFKAHLDGLSASRSPLFMRKLTDALVLRHPFEVRISFLNRMIFHPDDQWVASNTPASALGHLCQNDAAAGDIEVDAIDGKDAIGRAQRLGMSIQPLDAFLGQLAQDHLVKKA